MNLLAHLPFTPLEAAAAALALMTLLTFSAFGVDKWKARHGRWRIPEATLLLMAALRGSIGALLGMRVWHHKTLHRKFTLGIPLILTLQAALAAWLIL